MYIAAFIIASLLFIPKNITFGLATTLANTNGFVPFSYSSNDTELESSIGSQSFGC